MLEKHWLSVTRKTNPAKCKICSENTVFRCEECGPREAVCAPWNSAHEPCSPRQHDRGFYGLGHGDASVMGSSKKKWRLPSKAMVKTQHDQVANLTADE